MPWMSYFLGKIGLVLTTAAIEVVLIVGLGRLLFHLRLPTDVGHWWTLGWVFVLGITACTLLGIAMSSVPRNEKSAAAVVNLPFVALQFISGVFVPYNNLPGGLRAVASVFPLKWLSQGFRSAFLQRQFLVAEPGHSWQRRRRRAVCDQLSFGNGKIARPSSSRLGCVAPCEVRV
jgi:ABC-2 type transport system permease protein